MSARGFGLPGAASRACANVPRPAAERRVRSDAMRRTAPSPAPMVLVVL
ncbi:hypothetical protein SALBM135S_05327 [Streptomyces alboniger]